MDLPSLALVLQAALSPNPDERKAAEQSLNQVLLLFYSSIQFKVFSALSYSYFFELLIVNESVLT